MPKTFLSNAAAVFGIGVDELSVGNLTYFAGEEFTIVNEFDMGYTSLDEARGECCEGLTSGRCPASGVRVRGGIRES